MTTSSGRAGKLLLAGAATVGALLAGTPMAGAQPEPSQNCEQQQPPPPAGQQQHCDQGPGMPNLPDLPKNDGQHQQGKLSDVNCWMYPTGPYWNPPGAMPPPAPPGVQVWPCYSALGLQPTVPGM